MTESLWPDEIGKEDIKTPVSILKEQASMLGEKTKNIVIASVGREESRSTKQTFRFSFNIEVPKISYKESLFSISYAVELYPVRFYLDENLKTELGFAKKEDVQAKSEEEFTFHLKNIFGAERTRRLIGSLLSQVEI
ncbi:MAG: hypothetical protein ACFFCZ_29420 [Promethearchaeota archaeon]